jgi:hypothetical protein
MAPQTAFNHIADAKDRARIVELLARGPANFVFRTLTWTIVAAPDNPEVVALIADTPVGMIGMEFPKSEAKELARQLAALTSPSPGGRQ